MRGRSLRTKRGGLAQRADNRQLTPLAPCSNCQPVRAPSRRPPSRLITGFSAPEAFIEGSKAVVEECMVVMTDRRVRHLPVLDREKLVGIVLIGDLVKNITGG